MKYLILILYFFINCSSGPVGGFIYSSHRYAGEANQDTTIPINKEGIGCQHTMLGLFSVGDSGAGSTAKDNGIFRIATIDHSHFSIFTILYVRNCTIVNGATY